MYDLSHGLLVSQQTHWRKRPPQSSHNLTGKQIRVARSGDSCIGIYTVAINDHYASGGISDASGTLWIGP